MARHQTTNQSLYMEWQTRLYTMCTKSVASRRFIMPCFLSGLSCTPLCSISLKVPQSSVFSFQWKCHTFQFILLNECESVTIFSIYSFFKVKVSPFFIIFFLVKGKVSLFTSNYSLSFCPTVHRSQLPVTVSKLTFSKWISQSWQFQSGHSQSGSPHSPTLPDYQGWGIPLSSKL